MFQIGPLFIPAMSWPVPSRITPYAVRAAEDITRCCFLLARWGLVHSPSSIGQPPYTWQRKGIALYPIIYRRVSRLLTCILIITC
ncbi:unnamed protein product [Penicillium camemberti]|uniref:Str. FM013 n=1 Tax=Penicillium camemberti (strain FM 013) TaxID=1429867 RepID=A0A0G4PNL9_PENC3|nr:unnamed protein product [Penicillium camemberti]